MDSASGVAALVGLCSECSNELCIVIRRCGGPAQQNRRVMIMIMLRLHRSERCKQEQTGHPAQKPISVWSAF